ncbi:hypothetical protein Cgig2_000691 [Carnegiea gigantea]|uniref:Fe2OG dioxygenase domain-containing protein n=1 Tax=Carnegiea gigantea TaxID=171969 RepID=A0A9Q1QFT3_9CARY|nr:hypothetical protein Cgig2_000691 [Carnegiea gigantea]
MEKLVSSWSDGKILPESYIFPPGKRPGKQVVLLYESVPVIDLGKAEGDDHENIVINHGVPTSLMDDTRRMFKEFFVLPAEEKTRFLSSDLCQKCALYTSNVDYEKEEIHNWRDSLRHSCSALEECVDYWPQKPLRYGEVVGQYTVKVRELGSRILELICEGLGLERGFFAKELSQGQVLAVHHYPPCPDPSLTLGTRKHYDPGVITILLQGDVSGLQVLRNGEWIGIEAIPDAFVVNVGQQLQIVSNGRLRSSEHRAVTNKNKARITGAFFIEPMKDCIVEPAKAIVNARSPAIYKFTVAGCHARISNFGSPSIHHLQVVNHGVSTRLMYDTQTVFKEFVELPAKEKSRLLSSDFSRKFALFTSNVDYDEEEIHNWRDSLRHICFPLEESIQFWPQQPTRYRTQEPCDTGIYCFKEMFRGFKSSRMEWIGIEAIPDALVRFIMPADGCIVEPAKAIVNAQSPAIYEGVTYMDFVKTFRAAYVGEIDDVSESYTIRA